MRINYHYGGVYTPTLAGFLESIGFLPELFRISHNLIVFDIYDDDERLPLIKERFPNFHPLSSWYEFSDEEVEAADWLTMRSTNWKLEPVDLSHTFKYGSCQWTVPGDLEFPFRYYHAEQVAPYVFNRRVKWGRTQFLSSHTGNIQAIFCSDLAKSVIENAGLKGCAFAPVLRYKQDIAIPDVNQLVFENIIPDSCLRMYKEKEVWHCPVCGKPQYIVNALSRPVVDSRALGDNDFFSTTNNHSFDRRVFAGAFYIVSQKAYRVLKEHHLTRSLEFFPLLTF